MPELVTLEEDGPLGKAGDKVWVDDPADARKAAKPHKTSTRKPSDEK